MTKLSAVALIEQLDLSPHPEGGHYRELYRDVPAPAATRTQRGAVTSIYYLLVEGEVSHWHKVDATEIWCHHAGDGFELRLSPDGVSVETYHLGADFHAGQQAQITIPPGWWQAATPLGAWSLAGCVVAPAFEFEGFALAPKDWEPGKTLT